MKESRGFTLLEILLVLVLLAISSVAVIGTLPMKPDDEAKVVAQSLYQRLQLINEEAILSGRDFGLYVDESKGELVFLTLTTEGWKTVDKRQFNAELKVDSDLVLDFKPGGNGWKKDDRLFESGEFFEEMFKQKKNQQPPPQVFILSSGEITPFILDIHPDKDDSEMNWRVSVEDNGQIQLLAPGEQDEKA